MIHELKTEMQYFQAVISGRKLFEVRKNNRQFKQGDYVALNEINNGVYTGRCALLKIVYILSDKRYCADGYVVLGLEPCKVEPCMQVTVPVYGSNQCIGN